MDTLNWALIAPLIVIQFVLMIMALIDIKRIHATNGPKWVWILVVIVVNTIGPIVYFIFGRKNV
ncbi:Negative regulatory protein YxlE [Kurthia sp. 3B1D]|uniref:Negative regulatory protein YxlE n=2 Tax=Kurthia TaxID=1649 RepID=A0A433RQH5_9BACL|nr:MULTISPECIES: PLDc N-terminal domain-containing protein [unclassified Kurthia]RUS53011.1 Negative regulatory protein YxlE [Kurthia sp. 3B1D]HIX43345.1 PLDc N-terminal domain-containing protein [Candidatus Kurthia intestinigallinarum]